MFEDDDDDEFVSPYNNGHWEWKDKPGQLIFISHDIGGDDDDFDLFTPAAFRHGPVEFKDDLDLFEQQKFRKRFQRKESGEDDVVFLQDIKDVVLFTAPSSILNVTIIQLLHVPSTERFIRALILYCQYYLQITDTMSHRLLDAQTKLRMKRSYEVELEFRQNLEDLRLLVAEEYCSFLLGGKDYKPFHHMGPNRKSKSLSKKEAFIFESFISISIQMVWIALGRKALNQIEIEIHRLFKTQKYNIIEHKLKTNYLSNLAPQEKFVLLGHCLQNKTKLHARSPLFDESHCHRHIDYRLIGLGNIKFAKLTYRQKYLEQLLIASEDTFKARRLTLGILGLPRTKFDSMLMEIKGGISTLASCTNTRSLSRNSSMRKSSLRKSKMIDAGLIEKLYEDIILPEKTYDKEWIPESFPTETPRVRPCNQTQRQKWLLRQRHQQAKSQANLKKKRNLKIKK